MSVRFDTGPWISGSVVFGEGGFGVKAETIPSVGSDGPAYAYPSLSLPADAGKEIAGRITTEPPSGVFTRDEYTAGVFDATGLASGYYIGYWQLYVDGVATGSVKDITFAVGTAGQVNPGAGVITLEGPAPSVTQEGDGQQPVVVTPGAGVIDLSGSPPIIWQGPAGAGAYLTVGPLKNVTLTPQTSVTGLIVAVYTEQGAHVVTKTNQATDNDAMLTIFDVLLSVGAIYNLLIIQPGPEGAIGVDKAQGY